MYVIVPGCVLKPYISVVVKYLNFDTYVKSSAKMHLITEETVSS